MAKKPKESAFKFRRKGEPDRLKIEGSWEDAAVKLLGVKAGSVPSRQVKTRKKRAK